VLVIETQNLVRNFYVRNGLFNRKQTVITAVKGITFSVAKGEIFGLLGQNGAGKTTTIKMLITMLAPTSGMCNVLGYNTFGQEKFIRNRINFVFGGEYGLYRRLSARDNLAYFSNLYKIHPSVRNARIKYLLDLVGLSDKADLRVETYSKGMIQRVQIARGLINEPEILFLDEPTIGLDPLGAEMLRAAIIEINKLGTTIVLTTHNMYEADELCDRIAIIKDGEFLTIDTPNNIKTKMFGAQTYTLEISGKIDNMLHDLSTLNGVDSVELMQTKEGGKYRILCSNDQDFRRDIWGLLNVNEVISFARNEQTLEDAYIQLVKGDGM